MEKIRVFCPHCMNTNSVIRERMDQGPVCGICKSPLLPGKPVPLNGSQFEPFLSRTELPVLVNFGAPWCGHSRTMAPAFDAAAARMHPGVVFATVDTQADQPLAARFAIQSTPTMVLFRSGMEEARLSGAMEREQIISWLRTNLFRAR
jgi:thioredoxin 2